MRHPTSSSVILALGILSLSAAASAQAPASEPGPALITRMAGPRETYIYSILQPFRAAAGVDQALTEEDIAKVKAKVDGQTLAWMISQFRVADRRIRQIERSEPSTSGKRLKIVGRRMASRESYKPKRSDTSLDSQTAGKPTGLVVWSRRPARLDNSAAQIGDHPARIEVRNDEGEIELSGRVGDKDGTEEELRAALAAHLPTVLRHTGLGAEARIGRIIEREGIPDPTDPPSAWYWDPRKGGYRRMSKAARERLLR